MFSYSKAIKTFGVLLLLICFYLVIPPTTVRAATYYWVGTDGANASVASNWKTSNPSTCGGGDAVTAPSTADIITFDADCDNGATLDSSFTGTVNAVVISSGYTGTIIQARSLIVSTSFTTSGGAWNTGSQTLTITSTFTMNTGSTFTASSGTTTYGGNFTINGGTFNHNSGIVVFTSNGTSSALTCNNVSFNQVQLSTTGNTKTVNSSCTLPLGSSPTVGSNSNYVIAGSLSGTGTITFSGNNTTVTFNSGGTLSGFSGILFNNSNVTVSGATLDLSGYSSFTINSSRRLTVNSGSIALPSGAQIVDVTVSGGTLTAPSGTLTVSGSLTYTSGTFVHNNGTVSLTGSSKSISGSWTFYNLSKIVAANDTLTLQAGATQTIVGQLTLTATSGTLFLRSSNTGTKWNIDPQATRSLTTVDVKDSTNLNATEIGGFGLIDSDNNTGWKFTVPTVSNLGPTAVVDGSTTTSSQPTLTFTLADSNIATTVKYQVQIFNNSSLSTPVIDYTSALATQGSATFTVGQAAGSGTYSTGTANQSLYYGQYFWRVRAIDQSGSGSAWSTANSGNVAFEIIPVASGTFEVSDSTPFLGDTLTITGTGLSANQTYYLFNSSGGPVKNFTTTTYQGETATQLTSTQTFNSDTIYGSSFSHAYDEFDSVLVLLRYFDSTTASPLFSVSAPDISRANGLDTEQTVNVDSLGSSSWKVWSYVFDKDKGVPVTGWSFTKVSNDVYFNKLEKYPMWSVTTDSSGAFTKNIKAPRTYSNRLDLNFTFELFNPSTETRTTVASITLDPQYDDYRSAKDMLTFHYLHVRPEYLDQGHGVFANVVHNTSVNRNTTDWDNGFVGGIFSELGRDDLRNEQAERIRDTIDLTLDTSSRYCYPINLNNYTDCTFAGWVTLKPTYENTQDPTLLTAMTNILNYAQIGYSSTYNNFAHVSSPASTFWIDAGGGKPQFYWYMAEKLNDDTYKTHARTMINFMIDTMQDDAGWFNWRYNFATSTFSDTYWVGGQGWAGVGLIEFKELIKDESSEAALVQKINTSLELFADNISSRSISDLNSDSRRRAYIAYSLLTLANDSTFPEAKRAAWQLRGEQLFIEALEEMNSESTHLNRYGLTFYTTYAQAFPDYYLLKIMNEVYPDTEFFPNNIGSNYTIDKVTGNQNVYQAYIEDTDSWVLTTEYPTRVDSARSTLTGISTPDTVIKFIKRDFTADASSGNVDVVIEDWLPDYRKWTMTSESQQDVSIQIGGLSGTTNYRIMRDGVMWKDVVSDVQGKVNFIYNGGFSAHEFELILSSNTITNTPSSNNAVCNDLVPQGKAPWLYAAVAQNSNSVKLYFADADGPLDHYALEYGRESGKSEWGAMNIGGRDSRTYLVQSLQPNTTYFFRIRAVNGCSIGNSSNELSVRTLGTLSLGRLQAQDLEVLANSYSQTATKVDSCQTYTVKSGDSLWSIAEQLYGDGAQYVSVINDNQVEYPNLSSTSTLKIGWIFKAKCEKPTSTNYEVATSNQGGYKVSVKVVDEENQPVEGAKVTIHSKIQEGVTDSQGVVQFDQVEPGEHRVIIAYDGFEGEQKINASGEIKELNVKVTLQKKAVLFSSTASIIIGALGIATLLFGVLWIRNRNK